MIAAIRLPRRLVYWHDLAYELVSRELKSQYKRSALGIAWSLVNPLLQLLVFGFLFQMVLSVKIPRYSAYAFCGMLIWTWLQASIIQGARSITGNRDLVRRPGFPTAVLPVVSVATNLIHFLLAFPILCVFLAQGQAQFGPALLFLPVLILLQFVFSVSLAYLVGAFNVVFRDTQHILGILLQLVFFVTPVFFSAQSIPPRFQWVYTFNPVAHLVEAYRAVLLHDSIPDAWPLATLAGLAIALLGFSYNLFIHMSYRFAEEL